MLPLKQVHFLSSKQAKKRKIEIKKGRKEEGRNKKKGIKKDKRNKERKKVRIMTICCFLLV